MIFHYLSRSPEETVGLGRAIGRAVRGGDIIVYRGGLGAGKTTMTRGIALGMGLCDDVCSPTFAIVNEYPGKISLYHFDMYRLSGASDLESIGFYDYLSDSGVIVIEWSENVAEALPEDIVTVSIEPDGDLRRITIEGDGRFDFDCFRD